MPNHVQLLLISLSTLFSTATSLPATPLSFRFFRLGITSPNHTEPISMCTDTFGNTYLVGNTYASFGQSQHSSLAHMSIFAAKFSRSGILIWLIRTGSQYPDWASHILYHDSALYVAGSTKGRVATHDNPASTLATGQRDAFVMAFNSFTGKPLWSWQVGAAGVFAQANFVTLSQHGHLFVTGHSNGNVFGDNLTSFSEDKLFISRLHPHKGTLITTVQYGASDMREQAFKKIVPLQVQWSTHNSRLEMLVSIQNNAHKPATMFISFAHNLTLLSFRRLPFTAGPDVVPGLAEEKAYNQTVLAFSLRSRSDTSRDLAIQPSFSDTAPAPSSVRIDRTDMDSGSDDACRGLLINNFGIAFVLSSMSYEPDRNKQVGIWTYNVHKAESVSKRHTTTEATGAKIRIAGFRLDYAGNIVMAGVSVRPNGIKEVLLATYGVPAYLKSLAAYQAHMDPGAPGELNSEYPNSTPKPAFIESESSNIGFFDKDTSGRLSVHAILVISFIVVAIFLVVCIFLWCCCRHFRF